MIENYCVYFTIYRGNMMPPFYIGSSSISKVLNGYNGSPSSSKYKKIWKIERKNNHSKFKTTILKKFNTREEAAKFELKIQIMLRVHANPLYINMGYFHAGHIVYNMCLENCAKMAKMNKGVPRSEETKKKISESNKGKKLSDETKLKIGFASKNRIHRKLTEDEKIKISERQKGEKHHFYGKQLTDEHKLNLSKSTKNKPKSKETKMKMTKQTWEIKTVFEENYTKIDSLTTWCEELGLPVRDVRKGFKRSGKYKKFFGRLIE